MRRIGGIVLTVAIAAAACSRAPEPKRYEVRGQILSFDPQRNEVVVDHEDIEGFMPAMVMPYKVQNPSLLEGKKPGDIVTATLVVEEVDYYLTTLTTTGHEPITTPVPAPLTDILLDGDLVPDHALVDQTDKPLPMQSLRGHRVALTFMYTRCPLPDFCPLMDKHFADVQAQIKKSPDLADVQLVSVTLDPEFDTPAVLAQHAKNLGAESRTLAFRHGESGRGARLREAPRRHRRTRGNGRCARAQPEDRGHRFPGSPRQGLLRQHVVAGGARCRSQSDSPSHALTERARRLSRCTRANGGSSRVCVRRPRCRTG